MKKKTGLFGFLVHFVIISAFLIARNLRGEQLGRDLVLVAVPLLLLSSFLVYAFAVSRYVERREGTQKAVVVDSLVGMLAECMIFTLAAALFGIYEGFKYGAGALLPSVLTNLLWAYATFLVQMLVIGNLAGLVGWFVLKKKTP